MCHAWHGMDEPWLHEYIQAKVQEREEEESLRRFRRQSGMVAVDLVRECQRCLAQVADEVEGGVLYVDEGAGEALHYMGGLPFVLQLGVRSVCSLETASPLDAAVAWREGQLRKVVVLTTRLLSDSHRYILRCLRCHPSVRKCRIFTSISQDAHSACSETPLGYDAFREYTSLLQQDLQSSSESLGHQSQDESFTLPPANTDSPRSGSEGTEERDIRVEHLPMMLCPLTRGLFVLPSGGAVAEAPLSDCKMSSSLGPGLPAIDTGVPLDSDDHIPSGATLLAHVLQHLTAQLDLKAEVFTLGPLAQMVGKLVTGLASPTALEHGMQRRSAGLLIVDRSLDLITPTCHNDALIDRIIHSLPRRVKSSPPSRPPVMVNGVQTHSVVRSPMDFRIPTGNTLSENYGISEFPNLPLMASRNFDAQQGFARGLNGSNGAAKDGDAQMMGGSLATPWDQVGVDRLEALLDKSTKDATLLLRKWLHEALRQEKLPVPGKARLGAMTPGELASLRTALSSKPDMAIRHLGLLQVAIAVEETLSSAKWSQWKALASSERILRLSVDDGSQSVALQLRDMVQQTTHDSMLDLSNVLTLAIVGYALAGETTPKVPSGGPFAWEEEAVLKESLMDTILQGPSHGADLGFLRGLERAFESHWQRLAGISTKDTTQENKNDTDADDEWGEWEGVEENTEEDDEYGEVQLKLELKDRLEEVMSMLHRVAAARARLPLPLRSSEEQFAAMPSGLLLRLFSLTLAKLDIPGLTHHSSTVGRLFKSGLGRFGIGQPKPRLGDYKVIIVFVIGGIKGSEVREVREAQAGVAGGEGIEVIIGGTTFLTPSDMYDLLLGSCAPL